MSKKAKIKNAKYCYLNTTLKNNKNQIEWHSKSATDPKAVYYFTCSTAGLI